MVQHSEPHELSPHAPKFEGSSQEETLQQERCARRDALEMAKHVHKLKEEDKATFHSPSERSLVITSAIFDETRGKIISGRFQSINAHAEQERSELS